AEDGIRDFHVTGVQTCALPISSVYCGYLRSSVRICSARRLLSVSRSSRFQRPSASSRALMIRYSAGVMVARMSIIVPPSCSLLDGGADLLGRPPLRDKLATKDEVALAATLVSNRAELP